jgi:hypothetical protein
LPPAEEFNSGITLQKRDANYNVASYYVQNIPLSGNSGYGYVCNESQTATYMQNGCSDIFALFYQESSNNKWNTFPLTWNYDINLNCDGHNFILHINVSRDTFSE